MPAYLVVEIEVTDPDIYAEYAKGAPAALAAYGGRYLARGGASEGLEGAPPAGRLVILEFPDMAALKRFYDSPEYAPLKQKRFAASTSRAWAVEGAAPPAVS